MYQFDLCPFSIGTGSNSPSECDIRYIGLSLAQLVYPDEPLLFSDTFQPWSFLVDFFLFCAPHWAHKELRHESALNTSKEKKSSVSHGCPSHSCQLLNSVMFLFRVHNESINSIWTKLIIEKPISRQSAFPLPLMCMREEYMPANIPRHYICFMQNSIWKRDSFSFAA